MTKLMNNKMVINTHLSAIESKIKIIEQNELMNKMQTEAWTHGTNG